MKNLLLVFLLCGCAGKPWIIPLGMPENEAQRRHYECVRDAEYAGQRHADHYFPQSGVGAAMMQGGRELSQIGVEIRNREALFEACMRSNGFFR